ncbi:hypothetical protein ACO2Q0_05930 [Phenylobacterium sp. VNQ135]|uniref:hypothetical protein n=1 Tax=Phenylobacterium sp. VNQ135 TaxID=3400922 RepID=UPI003BFFDA8F
MARFSIDTALKSGFRLARREWGAVLVWGAAYLLLSLAMQMVSIGAALPAYMRNLRDDPEGAAAALEQASAAQAFVTLPVALVLGLALGTLIYGAVCRAMLRPDERGFFFMRLQRRELSMLLTMLAMGVLAMLVIVPIVVVTGGLVGGVSAVTGTPGWPWAVLIGGAATAGYLYLAARFSLAWVMAWDEQRFVLLDSWRLTKGQGWRMVLAAIALLFLLLIVAIVVMIPVAIVAGIFFAVAGMAGGAAAAIVISLVAIAGLIFFAAFNGVFVAAVAAAYVEIYRELRGVGLPGGETAEVFA